MDDPTSMYILAVGLKEDKWLEEKHGGRAMKWKELEGKRWTGV